MSYQCLVKQVKELLAEETDVFASNENAAYFRSLALAKIKATPKAPPPPLLKKERVSPPVKQETPLLVAMPGEPKEWQKKEKVQTAPISLGPLKALFQKVFPNMPILDEVLDDTMAKKIANRWKTKNQVAPISILHTIEPNNQSELLKNIVMAIDVHFGGANLINAETIEKEKQWEAFLSSNKLKLVIVCDYTLWQLHGLMTYYKENLATQKRTLNNTPLFLLPDLSLYLKDPLLKRSLWKALCKICS